MVTRACGDSDGSSKLAVRAAHWPVGGGARWSLACARAVPCLVPASVSCSRAVPAEEMASARIGWRLRPRGRGCGRSFACWQKHNAQGDKGGLQTQRRRASEHRVPKPTARAALRPLQTSPVEGEGCAARSAIERGAAWVGGRPAAMLAGEAAIERWAVCLCGLRCDCFFFFCFSAYYSSNIGLC